MRVVLAAVMTGSALAGLAGELSTNGPATVALAERARSVPQVISTAPGGKGPLPGSRGSQLAPTNGVVVPARGPAPGVYKTEPYTCIVVVPGRHADEVMAREPGRSEPKMPVINPGLRFVPWRPSNVTTNAGATAPKKGR